MKTILLIISLSVCVHGDMIDELIPVLIQVESGGDINAVGDSGRAFGCLQIWDVVIKDVNRVYGTTYKHSEMFFKNNSCEVCYLYLTYWGKHYEKKTGNKMSKEVLARVWNGGPSGYKKESTIKYWEKCLTL